MTHGVRGATPRQPAADGGTVAAIDPDSPAERAGIRAHDIVVEVNGHGLHDTLDWQWHTSGEAAAELRVVTPGRAPRTVLVERPSGTPWGLQFRDALFDQVRTCDNHCSFCFVAQLPPRLRPALYVRDDDFRLSFLEATFITLTNLDDSDAARIAEQHLSPLYVSLHAVTPVVRARLICAAHDQALDRFDELARAGIGFHVQIVLVPGENDGPELDRTLAWLSERPNTLSVGIVPVGYTRFSRAVTSSYAEPDAARAVIDQLRPWQDSRRHRERITWVHAADEFYLSADVDVPPGSAYDGFPQIENGIGLVRVFLDEIAAMSSEFAEAVLAPGPKPRGVLLTGEMFAPVLRDTVRALGANADLRVIAVANEFLGGNVSVTGLLAADDISSAIERDLRASGRGAANDRHRGPVYVLPDIVLNADGLTLDDVTVPEIAARTGVDIRLVSSDAAGLLEALRPQESSRDPRDEG